MNTLPRPRLTYSEAMAMFCIEAQPDKICQVKNCPAARFTGLARHAAQSAHNPDKALLALAELDASDKVDRWYMMLTLLDQGATPFWYTSYVDARQEDIKTK